MSVTVTIHVLFSGSGSSGVRVTTRSSSASSTEPATETNAGHWRRKLLAVTESRLTVSLNVADIVERIDTSSALAAGIVPETPKGVAVSAVPEPDDPPHPPSSAARLIAGSQIMPRANE